MVKFFMALLFVAAVLFVVPQNVFADDDTGSALRHAYKPVQVDNSIQARVNNMTAVSQKRLVCVEAFKNTNNAKTHLGCLKVDLAPTGSAMMWAAEFRVPQVSMLSAGTYNIVYTYRDDAGMWRRVMSMTMTKQDGAFVAL